MWQMQSGQEWDLKRYLRKVKAVATLNFFVANHILFFCQTVPGLISKKNPPSYNLNCGLYSSITVFWMPVTDYVVDAICGKGDIKHCPLSFRTFRRKVCFLRQNRLLKTHYGSLECWPPSPHPYLGLSPKITRICFWSLFFTFKCTLPKQFFGRQWLIMLQMQYVGRREILGIVKRHHFGLDHNGCCTCGRASNINYW